MTFGMPTGSARMPAVANVVPPEPPAEMTPPIRGSRATQRANASAMAATEWPRSDENTADVPPGCMLATCSGVTSAVDGLPDVDRSTVRVGMPSAFRRSRMNLSSAPFGVEGAGHDGGASDPLRERSGKNTARL